MVDFDSMTETELYEFLDAEADARSKAYAEQEGRIIDLNLAQKRIAEIMAEWGWGK